MNKIPTYSLCRVFFFFFVCFWKKSLRTCPAEGALRQIPSEREECRPRVQRIPASIGVPVEAVAGDLYAELRGQDPDAEQHDYFNVLSYRSLGSFSFPTETG